MEKLEQEMNAPEKMAETPSPKKTAGKKKKFRKNQVIITALAIMIAVAGYINYADSTLSTKGTADGTTADTSTVLKDISSLDTDITDEVDAGAAGDSSRTITETPGEAVLAGASTYMAQARIDREQIRSQNKDTLNEIINNTNLSTMTSADDLWDGYLVLREVADRTGIPVAYTTGKKEFLDDFLARNPDPAYVGTPVPIDVYMHRDWDSYIEYGLNTTDPRKEMY